MSDRSNLTGKKVVVGMTGRMDSAMAAFLLKKQGMQVIGLSIITVSDDVVNEPSELPVCHIQDLDAVKSLCSFLNIPFYATNARPRVEDEVLDKLVSNKLLGKANSSCFDCTRTRMKILYSKMIELDADFMATGHYAKARYNISSKEHYICSNANETSDQSFLLASTPNNILERLLLPLGELSKREVGKYVKHFGLPVSDSKSQEQFCFRSKKASNKIVESRVPKSLIKPGAVENIENNTTLGEHEGVIYHYLGEKELNFKHIGHVDKDLEVVGYDFYKGSLFVGKPDRLRFSGAQLLKLSTTEGLNRSIPLQCYVKFKYSKKFVKVDIFFKNNDTAFLTFHESVYPLIEKEAIVLYDNASTNSRVIGWGLVGTRGDFDLVNRVSAFERRDDDEDQPREKPTHFKF